jgi:hypothetical protein
MDFVGQLLNLLKQSSRTEFKQLIADTLVNILTTLVNDNLAAHYHSYYYTTLNTARITNDDDELLLLPSSASFSSLSGTTATTTSATAAVAGMVAGGNPNLVSSTMPGAGVSASEGQAQLQGWGPGSVAVFKSNVNYADWFTLLKKVFDATDPRRQKKSKKEMLVCVHSGCLFGLLLID